MIQHQAALADRHSVVEAEEIGHNFLWTFTQAHHIC